MRHRLRRLIVPATLLISFGVFFLAGDSNPCRKAFADQDELPSDYCFQVDVTVTYTGSGTLTNAAVRVPMNPANMIAANQMDERAWDILPIQGSLSNEVDLLAQDLSSSAAPFWLHLPSISQNETRIIRLYVNNPEQKRDQGILFTGGDSLSATHNAVMNISDNLRADVTLEVLDATAQNATLLSHWDSDQGYRLLLINDTGTLKVRAQVNALTCDLAWDSSWTDTNQDFSMRFVAASGNDLFIDRNGTNAAACDTDAPSITAPVADPALTVGTTLDNAIVREVRLWDASTVVGRWGFDAGSMTETVSSNPFGGTIQDYGANNLDFTYAFNRSQTDLTAVVGGLNLVSSSPAIEISDTTVDILGPAFGRSISTPIPEGTAGVLYTLFLDPIADSTGHRGMAFSMTLAGLGLFLAALVYSKVRYIPLALFVAGVPPAIGVINGWLPVWWMFLWAILVIGSWFAVRQGESA